MNTPKTTAIPPSIIEYIGVGPGTSLIFKSKERRETFYSLDGVFIDLNEHELSQMSEQEARISIEEKAMFCFID